MTENTGLARSAQAAQFSLAEIEQMAEFIFKSGLFGVRDVPQAVGLLLLAQAEGLHPMTAARDYHIIQGRPAMKAQTMHARHLAAGGRLRILRRDATGVQVEASYLDSTTTVVWDWQRVVDAGLAGKDMYKKYPTEMMHARAVSEAIRAVNPGVLSGLYAPEEEEVIEGDGGTYAPRSPITITEVTPETRPEQPQAAVIDAEPIEWQEPPEPAPMATVAGDAATEAEEQEIAALVGSIAEGEAATLLTEAIRGFGLSTAVRSAIARQAARIANGKASRWTTAEAGQEAIAQLESRVESAARKAVKR